MRDEQEPALLLWQAGQASWEQVGDLLEWSPRVIIHQQALEEALQWGIKVDAAWVPASMLEQTAAAVAHQQPVALQLFTQEDSLAEVVAWLKAKKQHSLNLLANAAANKYSLLQQAALLQGQMQIQVISQGWHYSFYGSGTAKKWLPEASMLRLISFDEKPSLTTAQVRIIEEQPPVQELQVQQSGVVEIGGPSGFWLGEQL